jgi:hypothetical protein
MMQMKKTGRVSLFRGKVRGKPLTVTLTPQHWRLVEAATERLKVTRADLIGLLLDQFATVIEIPYRLAPVDDDD